MLSILAVLAVLMVGTAGYVTLDADRGVTFLDALFMTVITVSTVGYEEVWALSPAGKIWTMGIIAFGIVTVSYAFTSLVRLVVSDEFRTSRERRRMNQTIEHMKNHVILCGYGRMGSLVMEELQRRSLPAVVIESDRARDVDLRDANIPCIIGDATEEELLLHAGLMRARALVLALPTDADNVFLTLTAHTLCPDLTIIARAEQPSTEAKLKRAGASRVVCPQVTGALSIVNVLTRPTVMDFAELASRGVDLEIDEFVVGPNSSLAGTTLREAHVPDKTGAMVVAIKKPQREAVFSPDPNVILESGDTLILVGPTGISSRLEAIATEG